MPLVSLAMGDGLRRDAVFDGEELGLNYIDFTVLTIYFFGWTF